MGDSKILELAKKLKALADKGVGGEKDNALAALQKLCKKNNIDASTLELEIREDRKFKVRDEDMDIFHQVADLVMGADVKIYNLLKNKQMRIIEMSDAEFLEMQYCWHHYKKLYDDELQVFNAAFIVANRIWNPIRPERNEPKKPLTAEGMRAIQMAEGIRKETYRKQLNKGK